MRLSDVAVDLRFAVEKVILSLSETKGPSNDGPFFDANNIMIWYAELALVRNR